MKYELKLKDRLYLMLHSSEIDRFSYLIPKVEKHSEEYFKKIGIKKPVDFYKYVYTQTTQILWEYENQF